MLLIPFTFGSPIFRILSCQQKENYLHFDFQKTTSTGSFGEALNVKLADLAGVFNRMVIKSSIGLIIQDTSNIHTSSKHCHFVYLNDRAKISEADYSDIAVVSAKGKVGVLQYKHKTYIVKIKHVLLNLYKAI